MKNFLIRKIGEDPVDAAVKGIQELVMNGGISPVSDKIENIVSRLGRGDAYLVKCILAEEKTDGFAELESIAPRIHSILT
jgi:hypothetical protein